MCAREGNIRYVTQWGSQGTGNGQFSTPYGIAVDTSGNIYVADSGNDRIQKFDSDGTYLTQFGTPGAGDGQFSGPRGVAVDTAGNIYVADTQNNRIQKFDSKGNYLMQINLSGYDIVDGMQDVFTPWSVAVDSSGNIYSVDAENEMSEFNSGGNSIRNWSVGYIPDGVAVDRADNVYVVFMYTDLQKYDSSGNLAADWLYLMAGNNSAYPAGVAVDAFGNVFVTESYDQVVQKYDPGGNLITDWGTAGSGRGQFSGPWGVAVDSSGNVYVADSGNDRIQKFTLSLPGSLKVTSEPAGAEIYLDNVNTTEVTPHTFEGLDPADYDVYTVLSGYSVPVVQTVEVKEGATATADFPLHRQYLGAISIIASKGNAEIWINNVDTGHVAPYTFGILAWGTYLVDVKPSCGPMPLIVSLSPANPIATVDSSACPPPALPEFPTVAIPAMMVLGTLGIVLFIRRNWKK